MISDNGLILLKKRYFLEGETWEHLIKRVVTTLNPNRNIQEIYAKMMYNLEFLPNTPTLINAGARTGQLMACFVLPIEDNMESIFDGVKYAALIHKSGGGTGFSFSKIREAATRVSTSEGIASGPVSFMQVYNAATGAIKQGGVRRGANMGVLRVDHPDIREFITCKSDTKQLTNFNISVAATDKFMTACHNNEKYDIVSPRDNRVVRQEDANEILNLIAESAHANGEPGLLFLDYINYGNPTPHLGEIEATNPCGEQPLLPYEACVLGSINLAKFVKDKAIDFEALVTTATHATMFLNDIIDASNYPLPEIEATVKGNRKIGLGVMGWADMLAQLNLAYDSQEATDVAREVMNTVNITSKRTSKIMAEHLGAYPFSQTEIPYRNATMTTIAPTGSISMIADCSSGIEPYFSLAYTKTVMDGEEFKYINPYLKAKLEELGLYTPKTEKHLLKTGSIQDIEEIPQEIRDIFKTALEIAPRSHIKMQSAFQEHVDNAVSKTINLPKTATVEDVKDAYQFAYLAGCKGITVYRDGSRNMQVLAAGYQSKKGTCPECNSKIEHSEGCTKCPACGWAVCE